jgi:hypothetical protein
MAVVVRAIERTDLADVGDFLTTNLNSRVPAEQWRTAIDVPWKVSAPNHGFLLSDDGRVVGVYLAFYSERNVDGAVEAMCNLGAWCVEEKYRFHSVKLLKALLGQEGYTFTDLSPSGNVVPLNERLKFKHLDTTTALIPGLPWFGRFRHVTLTSDPAELEDGLTGAELAIYRDHREARAARHVLIRSGADQCYVIFRKDRRKNLPVFASILYVSDPVVFARTALVVSRHLLVRHGVLAILAELRIVGPRPRLSVLLSRPRRKMFKSTRLSPDQIDYLYSELVCVAW